MAAVIDDFESEAQTLIPLGVILDPEASFVLRLAANLGARAGGRPDAPPVRWSMVVAAMLVAPDSSSRWLQWGARQGWIAPRELRQGSIAPGELMPSRALRAEALAATRRGGVPDRPADGWFSSSVRQQLEQAGGHVALFFPGGPSPQSSDASRRLHAVHLLAGFFLFPVGEHRRDDLDPVVKDPDLLARHIAKLVEDEWHLFVFSGAPETVIRSYLPSPETAWNGMAPDLRSALGPEDQNQIGPIGPTGRPMLALLARLLQSTDPQLAGDPLRSWFAAQFPALASAGLPEGPVIASIALGRHTLLERARALAALTTPGAPATTRHVLGAALAADDAPLPPSVHKLPAPSAGDAAAAWTGVRAEFIRLVRNHVPDDRPRAWADLILGESMITVRVPDDRSPQSDLLGFDRYAAAFASVIADGEVNPPLAIGLFGPWGSGKSAMIGMISDALAAIALRAGVEEKPRFCRGIVRIEFNAWHYAEAALWASLFVRIMEEISRHLADPPAPETPSAQRAGALLELDAALARQRKAEQELADAQLKVSAASAQHDAARSAENEARLAAQSAEAARADADAARAAEASGRRDAIALLGDAGVLFSAFGAELPELLAGEPGENLADQIAALKKELVAARGRVVALQSPLKRLAAILGWDEPTRMWLALAGGGAGILALLIAIWGLVGLREALAGTLLTTLASLAWLSSWLAPIWRRSQEALAQAPAVIGKLADAAEEIKHRVDRRRAAEAAEQARSHEETILLEKAENAAAMSKRAAAEVAAAQTVVDQKRVALQAERSKVADLEARMADLAPARLLAAFVAARAASADYVQHLGLPTRMRRDLDDLQAHLADLAADPNARRRVDRIVLFIDDLDRCSPSVVVKVLEAVHILLAFNLFVVVVGVDVRWLKRALRRHFRGQFGKRSVVDPEEFLEKIFQVPFWIPAMETKGRQDLIDAALPRSAAGGGAGGAPPPSQAGGASPDGGGTATTSTAREAPVTALPTPEPVTPSDDERAALLRWGAQAGDTPRRLKRFARSYMILRASLRREERDAFFANKDYETVARLLAFGSAAPELWPPARPSDPAKLATWDLFFGADTAPPSADAIDRWSPEIARFGFAEPNAPSKAASDGHPRPAEIGSAP